MLQQIKKRNVQVYREITSRRTPVREIISYQCVIFFILARIVWSSEPRFLGFTRFSIAMELSDFGIDYASPTESMKSIKRGDVYGSIKRQGKRNEKD